MLNSKGESRKFVKLFKLTIYHLIVIQGYVYYTAGVFIVSHSNIEE